MKMWPNSLEDPAYRLQLQKKIQAEVIKGTRYSQLVKQFPMDKLFSKQQLSSIFHNRMATYTHYRDFVEKEGNQAEALLCESDKGLLAARSPDPGFSLNTEELVEILKTPEAILAYYNAPNGLPMHRIWNSSNFLFNKLSEEQKKECFKSALLDALQRYAADHRPFNSHIITGFTNSNPVYLQLAQEAFKQLSPNEMSVPHMEAIAQSIFPNMLSFQRIKTQQDIRNKLLASSFQNISQAQKKGSTESSYPEAIYNYVLSMK